MLNIPPPKAGGPALPLSAEWMGEMHRTLRALSNIEVKRGGGDNVAYSDANVVITLKRIEDVAATFAGSIAWGKLQSAHTTTNDYVSVKLVSYNASTNAWDETGDAFNAALPVLQRNASMPSSDHADAVAVLWPVYASGDIVLMVKVNGGTGVEVSSADLEWCIVPNERSWCFEVPICTPDDIYYAIMPAWSMSDTASGTFNVVD
jgi:hypothetical protein